MVDGEALLCPGLKGHRPVRPGHHAALPASHLGLGERERPSAGGATQGLVPAFPCLPTCAPQLLSVRCGMLRTLGQTQPPPRALAAHGADMGVSPHLKSPLENGCPRRKQTWVSPQDIPGKGHSCAGGGDREGTRGTDLRVPPGQRRVCGEGDTGLGWGAGAGHWWLSEKGPQRAPPASWAGRWTLQLGCPRPKPPHCAGCRRGVTARGLRACV